MTPPRAPPVGVSAPDLTGPTSILNWPVSAAGPGHRRRARPYRHVHVEVDLRRERFRKTRFAWLDELETLARQREVEEVSDLLELSAGLLHALVSVGFSRVDHWEVEPGGWLPLPEPGHPGRDEPVGHLLRALSSDDWKRLASARSFSVRLSGAGPNRVDAVVRRVHRERSHALSLDVSGTVTSSALTDLTGAVRRRLPVLRTQVTSYTSA